MLTLETQMRARSGVFGAKQGSTTYITWTVIRVALGRATGLGWAFLPVTLVLLGVTIVVSIVQMRRAA